MAKTNATELAKTNAMLMFAELEYECEKDEQKCQECRDRFRCWTSRNLTIPILHYQMSRDIQGYKDNFEFVALWPRCFKCGNMVGSRVTIRAEHDNTYHIFHGIIAAQFLTAEGDEPMKLTIKGVGNQF